MVQDYIQKIVLLALGTDVTRLLMKKYVTRLELCCDVARALSCLSLAYDFLLVYQFSTM